MKHDTFENLPELNYLDLSLNQITVLPRNVFKPLISLVTLQLKGNQIQIIHSDLFLHNNHLLNLDLSNNSLKIIQPKSFRNNLGLSNLVVNDNRNLSSIDLFPENREIIEKLNLNNCGLTQLHIPKNIRHIFARSNKINSITAHGESVLWKLHIDDNNLTLAHLPPLKNLNSLHMETTVRNAFELIDFRNFSHFENLTLLSINVNPRQNITAADIKTNFPKLEDLKIYSRDMSIDQQKRILCNLRPLNLFILAIFHSQDFSKSNYYHTQTYQNSKSKKYIKISGVCVIC